MGLDFSICEKKRAYTVDQLDSEEQDVCCLAAEIGEDAEAKETIDE